MGKQILAVDCWAISERTARRLVIALMIGYIILFSLASSAKFWWFGQGHDLALHHQAIWNTTQGRIFEITGFLIPSRLFGYDPYIIELLIVPIYALIPSIHTLFVLQSLALGMAGLAVWHIARDADLSPTMALLVAILFWAYPTVQYTNLDAFRERSFGICFFLWAMWAFRRHDWNKFVLFLVLLIICRLEAALMAACFGIYAILCGGYPRHYMWVPLLLGLGYFFLGNFWFVPLVNQGAPVSYVYDYFAPLGSSMSEVIIRVITQPGYTIEHTATSSKAVYLFLLLLPLAGLPLLSPRELIFGAPLLALNLLATKPQLSDVRYWYSLLLVGPLIVATIISIRWLLLRAERPHTQPCILIIFLLLGMICAQLWPRNPVISLLLYHEPPARVAAANALVAAVPPEARVAATSRLAPHLLRRHSYYYPLAHPHILADLEYIAVDITADWQEDPASRAQFEFVQQSDEWELIFNREGFQLFRRRPDR